MWLYVKKWQKFEITEILYKIFADFFKRKEPTFASQPSFVSTEIIFLLTQR